MWQTKSNDRYSHIDKSDIDKIYKILNEKQKWYEQISRRFQTLKPNEDPTVLCSHINQEKEVKKLIFQIKKREKILSFLFILTNINIYVIIYI